ncbi:uncharacterized protein BJ171DRAFT_210218 [Polychytrium aggregatum]|uniref:uncharacterized protein n=1 Tax=Polychytrium aggregatum TaxID=110093 RepID=UPI0022FE8525|nr:uncharacterized protein BJ171DRAFT_210218 [Polychytrium aggregatum]KAI9208548.1 hypothetical protein BJ171DRAFT_210218 [Polychytrium aggregatum]
MEEKEKFRKARKMLEKDRIRLELSDRADMSEDEFELLDALLQSKSAKKLAERLKPQREKAPSKLQSESMDSIESIGSINQLSDEFSSQEESPAPKQDPGRHRSRSERPHHDAVRERYYDGSYSDDEVAYYQDQEPLSEFDSPPYEWCPRPPSPPMQFLPHYPYYPGGTIYPPHYPFGYPYPDMYPGMPPMPQIHGMPSPFRQSFGRPRRRKAAKLRATRGIDKPMMVALQTPLRMPEPRPGDRDEDDFKLKAGFASEPWEEPPEEGALREAGYRHPPARESPTGLDKIGSRPKPWPVGYVNQEIMGILEKKENDSRQAERADQDQTTEATEVDAGPYEQPSYHRSNVEHAASPSVELTDRSGASYEDPPNGYVGKLPLDHDLVYGVQQQRSSAQNHPFQTGPNPESAYLARYLERTGKAPVQIRHAPLQSIGSRPSQQWGLGPSRRPSQTPARTDSLVSASSSEPRYTSLKPIASQREIAARRPLQAYQQKPLGALSDDSAVAGGNPVSAPKKRLTGAVKPAPLAASSKPVVVGKTLGVASSNNTGAPDQRQYLPPLVSQQEQERSENAYFHPNESIPHEHDASAPRQRLPAYHGYSAQRLPPSAYFEHPEHHQPLQLPRHPPSYNYGSPPSAPYPQQHAPYPQQHAPYFQQHAPYSQHHTAYPQYSPQATYPNPAPDHPPPHHRPWGDPRTGYATQEAYAGPPYPWPSAPLPKSYEPTGADMYP